MQKSLRAGTKRPLTMVLVHAYRSFTSYTRGLWRPEGGQAPRAPAWRTRGASLVRPGRCCARWTQRGTVGSLTF